MKRTLQILLMLSSLLVPAAAQVTKISQEPRTNTAATGDDLLLNSAVGGGNYSTRIIAVSNFLNSLNVLTNVGNLAASVITSGTLNDARLSTATVNLTRYNVKRYGAIGDGVADDSAAILTAHNLATNSPGGILYFPAGTYKCTNLLTINNTFQNPVLTNYNTQISWYNVEGDGIGASTIAWSGTNSTFLSDTNAGVSIRNLSLVCMTAGTGGTNTGFKSWGGNGDGQVHFENVGFFNFMGAGCDLQGTFGSWIHGCIAGNCGIGFSLPVFNDGMDVSVGVYNSTNAGVMLGGVSAQFGTGGGNLGTSRAARIFACGSGNNIGFILGGNAPGTVVSGYFEATSNCAVACGHPLYMGTNYIDSNVTVCASIENLVQNSSGTNPLVRLFCNPAGLLTMNNVMAIGSTYLIESMTNSADNTAIDANNILFGFTEKLSTGVVITQPGIGQMLINKGIFQFQGSNLVASVSNGVVTAQSLVGPVYLDPDAVAFMQACSASNAPLPFHEAMAINNLVQNLKAHGTWGLFDAIYPMVGSSSNSMCWNLVNTNLYQITFNSGSRFDRLGLTTDGTASFGNTHFIPSSAGGHFSLNSAHLLVYNGTPTPTNAGFSRFMGVVTTSGGTTWAGLYMASSTVAAATGFFLDDTAGLETLGFSSSGWKGIIAATRTGASSQKLWAGGLTAVDSTTSVLLPNDNIYVGCENHIGTAGTFIGANFRAVTIGGAFSDAIEASVAADILTFETQLGRQ